MEVGVRELRARLSELLDRAEEGTLIRVTHRGEPKALIVTPVAAPLLEENAGELRSEARIAQGVREGWIRPAAGKRPPPIPKRGFKSKVSAQQVLREDRDAE